MSQQQQSAQQRYRQQSKIRVPVDTYPQVHLSHIPINAKQCEQLKNRLKGLMITKLEQVQRNPDAFQNMDKYQEIYAQNFQMGVKNQAMDKQICKDIKQMHQMADILLHPHKFQQTDLYLYNRNMPKYYEQEEIDSIFKQYEEAYEQNDQVDDGIAKDVIKRAKRFLLKNPDL